MPSLLRLLPCFLLPVLALADPPPRTPPTFRLPVAGEHTLHILSPTVLELGAITAPDGKGSPAAPLRPSAADFEVSVDGQRVEVAEAGFKRRVAYAPLKQRDLRVANYVYLVLAKPLPATDGAAPKITVRPRVRHLWPEKSAFTAQFDSLRWGPAIHVNQEGYAPEWPKLAMVGYYLGSLGELPLAADTPFEIVDAKTGRSVHRGQLRRRKESGFTYSPQPYQQVGEADFTALETPGEYRLVVPGLGASLPFRIDPGMMLNFTRAYALGLYHQRCGASNALPFTRFTHEACHTAPAEVPSPAGKFGKAWEIIAGLNDKKPDHQAPWLRDERSSLYPFVRTGRIDVSGGHHDAGDYSKYTINSAALIHPLMLAVDAFPGVAELDNLGLPESGDGISDVLQEAKHEVDFLAKLQDEDGGFYFLVYPRDRRYETGSLPEKGDAQIVWPKNTAATAAAVAALAQAGSSP